MATFEGRKSTIIVCVGEYVPAEIAPTRSEAESFMNFLRLRKIGDLNRIRAMMGQMNLSLEVRAEVLAGLGLSIIEGGVND